MSVSTPRDPVGHRRRRARSRPTPRGGRCLGTSPRRADAASTTRSGSRSLQPVQERFSEQPVIPEPLPTPIQWHEKQIRRLERSEDLRRPHPFEDRIAERAPTSDPRPRSPRGSARPPCDRCERNSDQKYSIMKRSSPENLCAHESVAGAFPPRQRREVYADRPALRRERERCDGRVRDLHSHARQELRRFPVVHREILRSDLEDRTIGTHASERARRPASPRERHLHPRVARRRTTPRSR